MNQLRNCTPYYIVSSYGDYCKNQGTSCLSGSRNTVFICTFTGFIFGSYLEQEADFSYTGLCVFNNANIDDLWPLFKRWWMYDLLIRILSMWTYKMPVQYIFWRFMVVDQSCIVLATRCMQRNVAKGTFL